VCLTLATTGGPDYADQKGFRHDSAALSHRYVASELIPGDIERTMEDAENVDVTVVFDQIGDAVMPVKENSHMAARCPIAGMLAHRCARS